MPMRSLMMLFVLALVACSADTDRSVRPAQREPGDFLTPREAQYRKSVVANPDYRLSIELDSGEGQFGGVVDLHFDYRGEQVPLTVDFRDGEILSLSLNGEPVEYTYNTDFITLPAAALQPGAQHLHIEYSHPYSRDGSGLYRFVDPEDGRVYVYSDFEPYSGNRMFPHFDQPDLKARYTLSVSAPAEWQVISTTRESSIESDGVRRVWQFPPTPLLSSYVFSLHAGEYAVFEDPEFRYPLRLFARQSMARYVDAAAWFATTRQGFDYFDDYFALPYPFVKYDQLLVPDYRVGAMENVAAVTYSEGWLSRGEATRKQRLELTNTILHEMAHMWFGDIATMTWWNGLWLNESFATYMAYLAMSEATEFDEAWHAFFTGMKQWAYWEDQLVTTHPIELPVRTTDDAFTNFDGITYGKGAAALKQLGALLGADSFRRGVRKYLADYAWSNAELQGFTDALAEASGRHLDDWSQRWLYQPGLNSILADYECEDARISGMRLLQGAPAEYPTLREHRTQVALYTLTEGGLKLTAAIPALIEGERTVVTEALGLPCPDLVYPNYGDWAYIKVALDEGSLETAGEHISVVQDPLQRSMLWYDLYSMVTDARLSLSRYLDVLERHLPLERDLNAAGDLLWNLRSGLSYLHQVPGGSALLADYGERFEGLLWEQLLTSDGDARQMWLAAYADTANTPLAWQRLEGLLRGTIALEGFELDQDQRWQIVFKLSEFRRPGYAELIATEAERDPSAFGGENALRAQVRAARGDEKMEWMERALAKTADSSLQRSRAIAESLFSYSSQRGMAAPYAERILAQLPELSAAHDVSFHDTVTAILVPRLCSLENAQRLRDVAERSGGLNPAIVKALRVGAQQDERCVNIGKLLAAEEGRNPGAQATPAARNF